MEMSSGLKFGGGACQPDVLVADQIWLNLQIKRKVAKKLLRLSLQALQMAENRRNAAENFKKTTRLEGSDQNSSDEMIAVQKQMMSKNPMEENYSIGEGDVRKLKVLNVHSYVHSALRGSHLRAWVAHRPIHQGPA